MNTAHETRVRIRWHRRRLSLHSIIIILWTARRRVYDRTIKVSSLGGLNYTCTVAYKPGQVNNHF